MYRPRLNGHHLLLLCVSALVVLSALLLSAGEVQGQTTNNQPTITTADDAYDFAENKDATDVVATFVASDMDSDADLTWTISGQ